MRKPLWIAIKQVVMAPFVSPTFFLTYVGDVFTSMIKVFQDLLWTVCFVASGDFLLTDPDPPHAWMDQFWYKNVAIPLVCLFPLWFRFNQCLRRYLDTGKRMPNLANSAKYALSQSVTLFGVFHPLYLMQSVQVKSFTDDHVDDSELDMIVLGSIRSNFFQVRVIISRRQLTKLEHDSSSPAQSLYLPTSVLLDGSFHCILLVQFLLGCLHGLGTWTTRVWLPWATLDVPKEIKLLPGDWFGFSLEVYVGANADTSTIGGDVRATSVSISNIHDCRIIQEDHLELFPIRERDEAKYCWLPTS